MTLLDRWVRRPACLAVAARGSGEAASLDPAEGMPPHRLRLDDPNDRPVISLRGLTRRFPGAARAAVDGLSLALQPGEILALLGPSGCGKTTTLRLAAGFEPPDRGEIRIDGELVARAGWALPPERRRLGMVFQDLALFPHLTVAENIAFGLKGLGRAARAARVAELLALVELADYGARYPHQLSGGQQQRVALARALAPRPRALLMDEPFSTLDAATRAGVRGEVIDILRHESVAALLVTHDQDEALTVADRVAVMHHGRVEQIDTPAAIYHRPATRFVARFIGEADLLPVHVVGGSALGELGDVPVGSAESGPAELLVRPEEVDFQQGVRGGVPAVVVARDYRGSGAVYTLRLPSGVTVRSRQPASTFVQPGVTVSLQLRLGHVVLFRGERLMLSRCLNDYCPCMLGCPVHAGARAPRVDFEALGVAVG